MSIRGHLLFHERRSALGQSLRPLTHNSPNFTASGFASPHPDNSPNCDPPLCDPPFTESSQNDPQIKPRQPADKRPPSNFIAPPCTPTSSPRLRSAAPRSDERIARQNCSEPSAQDATSPRRSIHIPADPPASGEAPHLKANNGFDHASPAATRHGIVVVHHRAIFRECFVRCLELSYKSHDIFAFTDITAWRQSGNQSARSPAVIVFFVDGVDTQSTEDLNYLETAAASVPVVIMSDIDDANHIMRALKGGARGYIPTSLPFNVAVEAVRLVEAGGTFVPASSFELDRDRSGTTPKPADLLTERQMMVAEALCQGLANKQIAYELRMSEHTVKVHLRHIMRKLKARNRTEVAVLTKDFF